MERFYTVIQATCSLIGPRPSCEKNNNQRKRQVVIRTVQLTYAIRNRILH